MLADIQTTLIGSSSTVIAIFLSLGSRDTAVLIFLVFRVTAVLLALALPANIFKEPVPRRCKLLITKQSPFFSFKVHITSDHLSFFLYGNVYCEGGENNPMTYVRDTMQLTV